MTLVDRILGLGLAAALLAVIVWGSNAPLTAHRSGDGVLRVAWSARPERIETCRQRSDEELARLPQHMREPLVCEGTTAEYRLQVRVDGALVSDRVLRGGGLRRDRRLYVLEELPLPPGKTTTIAVRLDRMDAGDTRMRPAPQPQASGPGGRPIVPGLVESVPSHLSLERTLRVAPRQVVLVTYDRERQELTMPEGTR